MKDYKRYIDLKTADRLLGQLVDLGCDTFTIEGGLNDTHLIVTDGIRESHKLGRVKLRKYLILGYEHDSEYHNHLYMQLTDNDKVFDELYKEYKEQVQEIIELFS